MGYLAVAIIAGLVLWLFISLLRYDLGSNYPETEIEQVDIVEGGSIVEQQRYGRERWRRAEVEIPTRPLSYAEELNLRSILNSGNENVIVIGNDDSLLGR